MKLTKYLLICISLLAVATSTLAATRVYQIDLIVFSHPTTKAVLSETWPSNPTLPEVSKAIELKAFDPATPNALYQAIPQRSKFAKETGILNKSGYRVLVDSTWLQPALTIKRASWIRVQGGNNISVNGMVKISRPYLFQVDADLILNIPKETLQKIAPTAATKIEATQFVLKQTASLRANQIYYLDHPLFGAMIRITPLNERVNESDL